jgi:hypothetical protein
VKRTVSKTLKYYSVAGQKPYSPQEDNPDDFLRSEIDTRFERAV